MRDVATGYSPGIWTDYELRVGLNNTTDTPVETGSISTSGQRTFELPAGGYTLVVKDPRENVSDNERYNNGIVSFEVAKDDNKTVNVYMSQAASTDQIRFVLEWGATPSDLDSHLLGPVASGSGRFHIAYYDKDYYYNNRKYADLDLDDTTSYGPETTTIYYKNGTGIYSFYVHDFTNRSDTNCNEMAKSGAKVSVYKGSQLMHVFRVPDKAGTLWHVCDYNPATDQFTLVNTVSYQDTSSIQSADSQLTLEQQDIQTIMASLPEKE